MKFDSEQEICIKNPEEIASADKGETDQRLIKQRKREMPSLSQVSALYSIAVILLIYIGFRVQKREAISGLLITELALIFLPSMLLLLGFKYDIQKVLRLHKVSIVNILIAAGAMLAAFPVVGALNALNLILIKKLFGRIASGEAPLTGGSYGFLISILIIACLPGVCEEIMFRGVMLRGFETLGTTKAILISACLFGLLHLDFQKFLGTFLLGALIGFIVYRTDSIFAGMTAHFTNNAVAIILTVILKGLQDIVSQGKGKDADKYISDLSNIETIQMVAVIIFYSVVVLAFAAALVALLYALVKNTSKNASKYTVREALTNKAGLLLLLPGIALVGTMYLLEGFSLAGDKGWLAEGIMKILMLN